MAEKYWYPTTEKTFPLKDLSVPPRKYAQFLRDCANSYISSVLEYHKSKTIEEALEKYRKKIRELNPDKNEETDETLEHILNEPLIEVFINGKLGFLKFSHTKGKNGENISREIKDNVYFSKWKSRYVVPLPFNSYEKEIQRYVSYFKKKLDKKYPDREDKIRGGMFAISNSHLPHEFELNLSLRSVPTSCLETNVILCNDGSVIPRDSKNLEEYFIPEIKIKTELLHESLDVSKKIVNKLEEVAKKYYDLKNEVSYLTSYTEGT